jgi:hypothetical protein
MRLIGLEDLTACMSPIGRKGYRKVARKLGEGLLRVCKN